MIWPGNEDSSLEKESEEKIAAANKRWDALFASAEGQKRSDSLDSVQNKQKPILRRDELTE